MLSKTSKIAYQDLHKTGLGFANPCEETTALSKVSRDTMSKKPGHVQPVNYDKLNALYSQFIPQKELPREQVYWQSPANVSTPSGNDDSTASSVNVQALETELCQLKDTITSLRIENDALKVTNANVHRCYKELTLSNTYLRNSSVETIKAQKDEITSLKAKRVGKPSSGTTKPTNPNVIASGMYAVSPKYIVPHRRDNRETPIPVPKKKHVTFREPQSTTRITSKPDTAIKQPNVSVPLSTGVKPASGASKPKPKSNALIYRRLSANRIMLILLLNVLFL
nr:hypothetical protein [Tanacetum cinerariifolium]